MTFSQIIDQIEAKIDFFEKPKAMSYINRIYDDAWTKTIDEFDLALETKEKSREWLLEEAIIYRDRILCYLDLYLQYKASKALDLFFQGINLEPEEEDLPFT